MLEFVCTEASPELSLEYGELPRGLIGGTLDPQTDIAAARLAGKPGLPFCNFSFLAADQKGLWLQTPMLAYLCGPIEFAADGGKMWRRKLKPFLRDELGHRVYDPAEDEKKNLTDEEVQHFREWKATDLERFRRVVRKIIHFDLDLIENKADYVICHWDEAAAPGGRVSGGTSAELTVAYREGIPVYLVTELPREQISGWMLACADQVFHSIDDLKKFLLERYGREKQVHLWKE